MGLLGHSNAQPSRTARSLAARRCFKQNVRNTRFLFFCFYFYIGSSRLVCNLLVETIELFDASKRVDVAPDASVALALRKGLAVQEQLGHIGLKQKNTSAQAEEEGEEKEENKKNIHHLLQSVAHSLLNKGKQLRNGLLALKRESEQRGGLFFSSLLSQ